MKQIISLHVGSTGINLGLETWKLYCLEHGIFSDGYLADAQLTKKNNSENDYTQKFFSENRNGKQVPRAGFIDLDREAIDNVRYGEYRHLFENSQLFAGKEDSGNNFARGYITLGEEQVDLCNDQIRKLVEQCDSPEGFMITHSVGGGTGSGFCSLLSERLTIEYETLKKFSFSIYPSERESKIVVQPYNSLLGLTKILEHMDVCMPLQNGCAMRILENKLDCQPSHQNINKLLGRVVAETTYNMRNDSCLNVDIQQVITNLIPYPDFKFISAAMSPLMTSSQLEVEKPNLKDLSLCCVDYENQFCEINPSDGKFMGCDLYYRGENLIPKDVNYGFKTLKSEQKMKFIDWFPTGVKVGINYNPRKFMENDILGQNEESIFILSNMTTMKNFFYKMSNRFDALFRMRAFTYWFIKEGFQEETFVDFRERIQTLIADYQQAELESAEEQEG